MTKHILLNLLLLQASLASHQAHNQEFVMGGCCGGLGAEPQPPEANGGLGAKPLAAGDKVVWGRSP